MFALPLQEERMTDQKKEKSSADKDSTPSGFQPVVSPDESALEEENTTAAAGSSSATGDQHGRPNDDEDDGHS